MNDNPANDSVAQAALLFDCEHYRGQTGTPEHASDEALFLHYLEKGWQENFDPHPYFSTAYYLSQVPELRDTGYCPLLHYFCEDAVTINPHILFEADFYVNELEKVGCPAPGAPLLHYLTDGHRLVSPHPLFDSDFYMKQQVPLVNEKSSVPAVSHLASAPADMAMALIESSNHFLNQKYAPVVHYIICGWQLGLSPHPLFAPAYYQAQSNCGTTDPLAHYLQHGHRQHLSPHPLFMAEELQQYAEHPDIPLLVEYILTMAEGVNPHWLFDYNFYQAQLDARGISRTEAPVLHYLKVGHKLGLSPSLLFDPLFYETLYTDYKETFADSFSHFVALGLEQLYHPHPCIDIRHLSKAITVDDTGEAPSSLELLHHLYLHTRDYEKVCSAPGIYASALAETSSIKRWIQGPENSFFLAARACTREEHPGPEAVLQTHLCQTELSQRQSGTMATGSHVYPEYRALICHPQIAEGPALESLQELGEELAQRGILPVFVGSCTKEARQILSETGLVLNIWPYARTEELPNILIALHMLQKEHFTFALLLGTKTGAVSGYLRFLQIPCILCADTLQTPTSVNTTKLFSLADAVVFPSQLAQRTFARIAPENAVQIYPPKRQRPRQMTIPTPGGVLAPTCHHVVIPFNGQDSAHPEVVLEVVRCIASYRTDVHFCWLYVGDRDRQNILRLAAPLFVDRDFPVTFFAPEKSSEEVFSQADVLLETTLASPFSDSIAAGIQRGIPVVAFADSTGAEELFREKGAWFVPRLAAPQMARQVTALLDDIAATGAALAAGQEILRTELSYKNYLSKILQIAATQLGTPVIGTLQVKRPLARTIVRAFISGRQAKAESALLSKLVSDFSRRGFDARAVAPAVLDADPLPDGSTDTLPAALSIERQTELLWRYLLQSDCSLFIAGISDIFELYGPDAALFFRSLPSSMACIGIISDWTEKSRTAVHTLGPSCNRIVCTSEELTQRLQTELPALQTRCRTISGSAVEELLQADSVEAASADILDLFTAAELLQAPALRNSRDFECSF